MKSKKIVASVACALAGMCAMNAQAIEIYPVDHARFMTNARFDLCARQGVLLVVQVHRFTRRGARSSDSARASW